MHVTIYNFDGDERPAQPVVRAGAGDRRDAFSSRRQAALAINPDDTSHTFAVPGSASSSRSRGVADDAKNQCGYAPCALSMAHRTITFTFHTGKAGHYRWQCFVPCAAGASYGFGGPMQTIGYMDGFLNVDLMRLGHTWATGAGATTAAVRDRSGSSRA